MPLWQLVDLFTGSKENPISRLTAREQGTRSG